jgi:beta-glucanase (GH16 family)
MQQIKQLSTKELMKKFLLGICLFSLFSSVLYAQDLREWQLIWSDEFNYEGLPDPTKWTYEEGFIRNYEMQYYTQATKKNARVENGMLVIEGRKEKFKNPKYQADSDKWHQQRKFVNYTSASLTTLNKASWKYGRIEVRAKLPRGKGVWPAIWTLGENCLQTGWPRCGEIDIMEFFGKEPNEIQANIHYAAHETHRWNGRRLQTHQPYANFHIYAIEWYPDRIDFFFDTIKYFTFTIDSTGKSKENPFRQPHYLLINLALGGIWGDPINDKILPQQYLIDYVRVYRRPSVR